MGNAESISYEFGNISSDNFKLIIDGEPVSIFEELITGPGRVNPDKHKNLLNNNNNNNNDIGIKVGNRVLYFPLQPHKIFITILSNINNIFIIDYSSDGVNFMKYSVNIPIDANNSGICIDINQNKISLRFSINNINKYIIFKNIEDNELLIPNNPIYSIYNELENNINCYVFYNINNILSNNLNTKTKYIINVDHHNKINTTIEQKNNAESMLTE
jgi:hypothetical protein